MWWYHSTKTAKIFWVTLDVAMHGVDWLSMVLCLRQHYIGYTADGFYRSDDPTNSVKALKEGGSSSRQASI